MKHRLLSLLLLPALLLTLVLPVHAATGQELVMKMDQILSLVENLALDYTPLTFENALLQQDLAQRFDEDPALFDHLMDEILSSLDSHSMYLPAGTYSEAFGAEESYVGIGITMEQADGQVRVKAIDQNGPAAGTGLQIGDILTSVNGQPLPSNVLNDIAALVRGEAGTSVTIGVRRGVLELTFTITRAPIVMPTLTGRQLEEGIYYMDLERFTGDDVADEFRYQMLELTRLQSKVLIFDLRGNPGGDLNLVTYILNRLIPDDDVPYFAIETRPGLSGSKTYTSDGRGPRLNQIILLTDGGSASASEVMTAALCDLNYAVSVGTTTLGKARGQQHFVYEDGSAAVITTVRLVPPSGIDYEGSGLKPDYAVENRSVRHPAAFCRKLNFRYLARGTKSWQTAELQAALKAMGYLAADCTEADFGKQTLDALNRFRADCGLRPMTYLNAESVNRINQNLEALSQQTLPFDAQLDKALELARTYIRKPLQYTADKYGQFRNIQ